MACCRGLPRRQLCRGGLSRQLPSPRWHSSSSSGAAVAPAAAAQALVGTTQGAAAGAAAGEGADIVGMRLAHENTYLSWSRNGIIATVAAVGLHTATLDENQPTAQTTATPAASAAWPYHVTPPAAAMLGVASTFFSFGTVQYIAQLSQLSKLLKLSPLRKMWMAAHCLAATTCWAVGVTAFVTHEPQVGATKVPPPVVAENLKPDMGAIKARARRDSAAALLGLASAYVFLSYRPR